MVEFQNMTAEWLPVFWLILAIVLGVIEAVSFQIVAIWFAIGAIAAIVPAMLGAPMWVQFVVFVVTAVVTLVLTRPFAKKFLRVKRVKTNADSVIGKIGVVIEEIDNAQARGRVHVAGQDWTARSEDGEILLEQERVLIKDIEGVKLIVERLN